MNEQIKAIRAEIERRHAYEKKQYEKKKPDGRPNDGWTESLAIMGVLEELLSFLDTIQVDEPEGLDDAAEKYAEGPKATWHSTTALQRAFKAGAEWMAGQGETIDGSLCYDPHLQQVIVFLEDCPKMWEGSIMDVTVQIRKKED